ncbi:hypothetical protein EVAR_45589_1 [Eumeta japonica]|uniref:Mariner Mos1 transposase n=1 Tax=Eumeta variegata TaxID=151549 RepID=A0A4C1YXD8_EUMVA|nr:hypothetical protein EVAR_45589_1 [Eumeta japonica]
MASTPLISSARTVTDRTRLGAAATMARLVYRLILVDYFRPDLRPPRHPSPPAATRRQLRSFYLFDPTWQPFVRLTCAVFVFVERFCRVARATDDRAEPAFVRGARPPRAPYFTLDRQFGRISGYWHSRARFARFYDAIKSGRAPPAPPAPHVLHRFDKQTTGIYLSSLAIFFFLLRVLWTPAEFMDSVLVVRPRNRSGRNSICRSRPRIEGNSAPIAALRRRRGNAAFRRPPRRRFACSPRPLSVRLRLAFHAFETPFFAIVYNWFNEFKRGRTNLTDDLHEGPPFTATAEDNISAVWLMIETDKREAFIRRIPYNLIKTQKYHRVNWCLEIMQRFAGGDLDSVYDMVTDTEILAHPPFSPNLVPRNFTLFPKIKEKVCRKWFTDADAVAAHEKAVEATFKCSERNFDPTGCPKDTSLVLYAI